MPRKLMIAFGVIGLVTGQADRASAAPLQAPAQLEAPRQTKTLLRTVIDEIQLGKLDLSRMEPTLQEAMRQQMPVAAKAFQQLGALQTIKFAGTQNGLDIYRVAFQNGATNWAIRMSDGGKIAALMFHRAPS
jgi:hypothetical protein